ncbi:MAG TPA: hypothetical protein VFD28_02475 [Candidatus Eisenbacteria bacterium]|nr:hypothetical protein [Candidatus Eisenbacteria bacterium]
MYIIKEAPVYDKESAWKELKRYNDAAGRLLNKKTIDFFKEFTPEKIPTIYRGFGFHPTEARRIMKKFKIGEMKKGAKIKYQTGKIQSWSTDRKQAEEFMGLHIFGSTFDKDSLGVLIKITNVKKDDVAVPIAYLPKADVRKYLSSDQDEILMQPGNYITEVVDYFGDWSPVDVTSELKSLAIALQLQYGGTITKTWNKGPGISLNFDNIYMDKKWSPSIEVQVDTDMEVRIEVFTNKKIDKQKVFKNTSKKDVVELIKSKEFLKAFDVKFNALKSAYS